MGDIVWLARREVGYVDESVPSQPRPQQSPTAMEHAGCRYERRFAHVVPGTMSSGEQWTSQDVAASTEGLC